ncbi:MAG: glycoside hydrolase family 92 protein [Deltaproteobacteria bacterium]|nr:MAG: glycoside hydrolase family 92 protein [Deltaproteobacteria bacterium]
MLLLAGLMACTAPPSSPPPTSGEPVDLLSLVDPFIGTGGRGFSVGNGYPGATVPLGLVKVSPDTADVNGLAPGYHHGGGYHYDDVYIQGFSHLHMYAIGVTDYAAVAVMPVDRGDRDGIAAEQALEPGYRARFDHDHEEARPGWYAVELQDPDVSVELTATAHTALHRYRFADSVAGPTVIVDLGHTLGSGITRGAWIDIDPATGTMQGEMVVDGELTRPFRVWFVAVPDRAPTGHGTWTGVEGDDGSDAGRITVVDGATSAARKTNLDDDAPHVRVGGWLAYPAGTEEVRLRVAVSTVDLDGAWLNLEAEATTWDLATVADDAWAQWEDALSPIRVWGGRDADRVKLATALYHCLQMPTLYSDVDWRYRGFDDEIHLAGHRYHTDYSLWDTYRTLHPLYTLLWPATHHDLLASFARMVQDGGNLPRWAAATYDSGSMVGTPANIVWAEAWRKGIRDWGEEIVAPVAVDVALGRITPDYGGRPDPGYLDTYGYLPADLVDTSVARTQELAISDYALAEVAADFGRGADAAELRRRSHAWRNLYNPETGWFQGRLSDGSFQELSAPDAWDDVYAEGNARQYLWLVPHEPEALFAVLGGADVALDRLTEMMEQTAIEEESRLEAVPNSWYWHGNEPSLHIPWLFALAGRPDRTRLWVRWVMDTFYSTEADGITGNDDAGTSSAWFVWAAMGLYPLAGSERYVLGLPAFERIEFDHQGDVFTITSDLDPLAGDAPVEVSLDGQPWPAPHLAHPWLRPGGWLHFGAGG